MKYLSLLALLFLPALLTAQSTPSAEHHELFEQTKAATVVVLAGEGAGRLKSLATGVVIDKNGRILTAYHAVKDAAEVQIRSSNGEVFDRVQLLGFDERRDVAELKITASGLPFLPAGTGATMHQGDAVFAVTNAAGLNWSATEGIFSAIRMADEVPGAGVGFRLMQFTAPIAPGSSGGALVNAKGELVGIITGGKGNAGFAVPVESVLGLGDGAHPRQLGIGSALELPLKQRAAEPQSSAVLDGVSVKTLIQNAHTVVITSKTAFLTVDTVDKALLAQKDWEKLGLTIVKDERVADMRIEFDRPLFTYVHTFVISDKKTSAVLGSGKVTAFDGTIASGRLSKEIVKILAEAKLPPAAKK